MLRVNPRTVGLLVAMLATGTVAMSQPPALSPVAADSEILA